LSHNSTTSSIFLQKVIQNGECFSNGWVNMVVMMSS
jgi:hypothetical protein